MSLPPISPSSRFVMPISTRNSPYKFKTSCNIRILNPLIPFYSKDSQSFINSNLNKASEVMSSIPPPSLHRSKFTVSRLSPSFPIGKPTRRCKNTTYLRQKYIESLEKERHSELSLNFNTPIRDYFEETVNSQKIAQFSLESEKNNTNANTVEIEAKVVIPEVHIQEAKHEIMKPSYANFVMPPPFVNEKKNLMQKANAHRESIGPRLGSR